MSRPLNLLHLALVSIAAIGVGVFLKTRYGGDWVEFAGFVTGVVGVYLVAVEHMVNWPVGITNVLIYAWVFFQSRLFADMTLQFFFLVLSVMGWIQWARGGEEHSPLTISRLPGWSYAALVLVWIVGVGVYVPIITHFKGAQPFADSALTVASIVAQLLLNRKYIENWIIWIVVDVVYIRVYLIQHLVQTAVLYLLLTVLAISGLFAWWKTLRALDRQAAY